MFPLHFMHNPGLKLLHFALFKSDFSIELVAATTFLDVAFKQHQEIPWNHIFILLPSSKRKAFNMIWVPWNLEGRRSSARTAYIHAHSSHRSHWTANKSNSTECRLKNLGQIFFPRILFENWLFLTTHREYQNGL